MFITIFSSASSRAIWAINHLIEEIRRDGDGVSVFRADTLAQLREQWATREYDQVILICEAPDQAMARLLTQMPKIPIALLFDDIDQIARSYLHGFGGDAIAAGRSASCCLAALHDMVVHGEGIVSLRFSDFATRGAFSDALRDALVLVPRTQGHQEKIDDLFSPPPQAERGQSPHGLERVLDAIAPFAAIGQRQPVRRLAWPAEFFLRTERNAAPQPLAPGAWIELEGRARVLIFGPYLHLPAGRWRVRAEIEVEANASKNQLFFELCVKGVAAFQAIGALPTAGRFALEGAIDVSEPRDALELRLSILQGAIEGRLRLNDVDVMRDDA